MPKIETTKNAAGTVTAIDIVYDHEEKALAAKAAAILGIEVDEVEPDDFWCCPGCGQVSTHCLVHAGDNMPMTWGDMFSTRCGHCRVSFAPLRINGERNPILSECNTHVDVYGDDEED